jgi:hypothetical protein
MNKTTAIKPNRLLILTTLIIITGILIYLTLTLANQYQLIDLPWDELASVGWVSAPLS